METRRLLHVVVLLAVVALAGGEGPTSATSAPAGCVEDDKYTENFETGWASDWYLGPGFQIVTEGNGKALHGGGASNDKGASWTQLVTLGTGSSKSLITGVVVDPLNPDIIYASNVEGVYKSEDGGAS